MNRAGALGCAIVVGIVALSGVGIVSAQQRPSTELLEMLDDALAPDYADIDIALVDLEDTPPFTAIPASVRDRIAAASEHAVGVLAVIPERPCYAEFHRSASYGFWALGQWSAALDAAELAAESLDNDARDQAIEEAGYAGSGLGAIRYSELLRGRADCVDPGTISRTPAPVRTVEPQRTSTPTRRSRQPGESPSPEPSA